MIPLIWLIAGVVLIVAEVVSGEFVLLMLGGAALVAAGASALGVPVGADIAVFAAAAAMLVLVARPALNRRLAVADPVNTGTEGLLGSHAEVVDPIEAAGDGVGTVRIGGAVWSARALDESTAIDAGAPVVVVEIRGATAVVTTVGPARPEGPETGGT